MEMKFWF